MTVRFCVQVGASVLGDRAFVCVVAWLGLDRHSVQFVVNPVVGGVGFTLALLVFWSRLYLTRHDLRETLVGAFRGLLGGLVTPW